MHGNAIVRNLCPVERRRETTDVFTSVCSLTSLLNAEQRCHRNVGYKNSVSRFHMLALSKCYDLCTEIATDVYRTQQGESFEIYEPKHRIVTSTKYKDRIPQASFVKNYMYKEVVPNLIKKNFACIEGRGVDAARESFKQMLREASMDDWCLSADLKKYFDSINHSVLFEIMNGMMNDEWAIKFYAEVINSNKQEVGISLGSEINQMSAVSFLNDIDHNLEDEKYERYMDDVRFIGTKEECVVVLCYLKTACDILHLKLSEKKTFIQPVKNPIKFLGFTFLKHPNGKITMKRAKDKLNNEKRKLRRMKQSAVAFPEILEHYRNVRANMKKGCRSGVVKLDRYFNNLFKEEIKEYADKEK